MKTARSVCTMAGLAVWAAGLVMVAAGFGAAARGVSGGYASHPACTAPPAADGKKRTVPEGHAKASSYAPQPRSPNRAYGAPVQKPILSKRKRTRHRTDKPAAR
jgi:hypothetical protein